MAKRLMALALLSLMLIATFTGCKKQEYGEITDVEIISGGEQEESEPAFERQDNPLVEYDYRRVEFECAKMAYEIPKTWQEIVMNPSCIKYEAPADDPYFPGITFYVKCVYDYRAEENTLDPFAQYANEFGKIMAPYITGLPFPVDGKDAWIRNYSVSNENYTPAYCKDESKAIIKVTKDVTMMDNRTGGAATFEGMDFAAAYLRWENFPVMFAATVPAETTDNAKALLEYTMSTTEKIPHKITQTKGYSYRKIRFTAPSGFSPRDEEGNIFTTDTQSISSYAGMTLGIFGVNETLETLTEAYINEHYANAVSNLMLAPSYADSYAAGANVASVETGLSDEKMALSGFVNIIPNEETYTNAITPYGAVSVWPIDIFIVERDGQTLLVAMMYPPNEADVAKDAEKMVLQSLAIAK